MESKDTENLSVIVIPIFLVICNYIELIKLLKDGVSNAQYDLEEKLCGGCANLDWSDSAKIEEAMTIIEDDKDEIEDFQEKIR